MTDSIVSLAQSRGPAILAIGWTFVAVSTLFVVARVYTRLRVTRNLGYDDGLVVIAVVSYPLLAWR
jgi:hypothetical protein